jgi:Protein of unknown function (DUF4054)
VSEALSGPIPLPLGTPAPPAIPTSTISDPPTFRSHFPEFADTTVYPDSQVQFYLDMASVCLDPCVWGSLIQPGVELMTAHMLALSQYAMQGGQAGGVPGLAKGLMTNKSVSKVSVGYDVNVTAMEGAGPWNYTIYGQRFYWLMGMVGRGNGGYEVLGSSASSILSGIALTWSRGVMMRWGS